MNELVSAFVEETNMPMVEFMIASENTTFVHQESPAPKE